MRRLIPAVFVAAMLAACSESSTGPEASPAPEQGPSFSVTVPGTTTAIASFSCRLVSSSKGEVLCSYDISNPDGLLMNVIPSALVDIAYQCVNPTTGKVLSTGTQTSRVEQRHMGITATTYSATDEQLPTASLSVHTNHPYTKLNPCKAKQTTVATSYSLQYHELYIDDALVGQPGDVHWACVASDTRRGCKTL
jgi:hypothetical protein